MLRRAGRAGARHARRVRLSAGLAATLSRCWAVPCRSSARSPSPARGFSINTLSLFGLVSHRPWWWRRLIVVEADSALHRGGLPPRTQPCRCRRSPARGGHRAILSAVFVPTCSCPGLTTALQHLPSPSDLVAHLGVMRLTLSPRYRRAAAAAPARAGPLAAFRGSPRVRGATDGCRLCAR